MCFSLCSDAYIARTLKKVNPTPVLLVLLGLPPWLRYKFASIFVAAIFPEKVRNYNTLFRPIIRMIRCLQYPGINIFDASIGEYRLCRGTLLSAINDYEGMRNTNMQKTKGLVGACHNCKVMGISTTKGITSYPSGIRYLNVLDDLRDDFEAIFNGGNEKPKTFKAFFESARKSRPSRQTHAFAIAQGTEVDNARRDYKPS